MTHRGATTRSSDGSLTLGVALSIIVHLLLLVPFVARTLSAAPAEQQVAARFDPEDIAKPDPADDPIMLGLEDGDPSTLTWIGYEQYQEHLAALGQVEQAAFDITTPAGASAASAHAAPQVETDDQPPAEAVAGEANGSEQANEVVAAVEQADAAAPPAEQTAAPLRPVAFVPSKTLALLADLFAQYASTQSQRQEKTVQSPANQRTTANSERTNEATDAEAAQAELASSRTSQSSDTATNDTSTDGRQQQEGAAGEAVAQAEQSDRQSDATSVIDIPYDQLKAGKPLAARGLELKPRKPSFTTLQLVTAAPCCNPLVTIEFGPNGKPTDAWLNESSGSNSVDNSIESSLFGWRASGKQIDALAARETLAITIRIVLVDRGDDES